jgi:hypothetical protein
VISERTSNVAKYEDDAIAVHPTARDFRPVEVGLAAKKVLGWTYSTRQDNGDGIPLSAFPQGFGWVTVQGDVSRDVAASRRDAIRNMRAFLRTPLTLRKGSGT